MNHLRTTVVFLLPLVMIACGSNPNPSVRTVRQSGSTTDVRKMVATPLPVDQTPPTSNQGFEPKTETEAKALSERLVQVNKDALAALDRVKAMGVVKPPPEPTSGGNTDAELNRTAQDPSLLSPKISELHDQKLTPTRGLSAKAYIPHGYTGWWISSGEFNGFSTHNTASLSVGLPISPWIFGYQKIYAPTTKTINSCVEVLTSTSSQNYFWIPSIYHEFWVWNWCRPGGSANEYNRTIDANFINTYMRLQGVSPDPEYSMVAQILSDGLWHVLLYNFNTSAWDDVYHSTGAVPNPPNQGGWTIFEMYLDVACPFSIPTIYSESVKVQTTGTNKVWRNLSQSDGGEFNSPIQCSEAGFYAHRIYSTSQSAGTFSGAMNLTSANTLSIGGWFYPCFPFFPCTRTKTLSLAATDLGRRDGTTTITSAVVAWGDGTITNNVQMPQSGAVFLQHTYTRAGTFNAGFTAVDNQGNSASNFATVTVN
jgi:hypothetical protein